MGAAISWTWRRQQIRISLHPCTHLSGGKSIWSTSTSMSARPPDFLQQCGVAFAHPGGGASRGQLRARCRSEVHPEVPASSAAIGHPHRSFVRAPMFRIGRVGFEISPSSCLTYHIAGCSEPRADQSVEGPGEVDLSSSSRRARHSKRHLCNSYLTPINYIAQRDVP